MWEQGKKTLLFYNKRGTANAWICQDCGYFEKCPHCDIALSYHAHPSQFLLCHQCNTKMPYHVECPHCHGHQFVSVGVGIEQIEQTLKNRLDTTCSLLLIDSDHTKKTTDIFGPLADADVILSTQMGSLLQHPDIGAVVFLLFEVNLSVPEYDLEEELYTRLAYIKKQNIPLYIQTHIPDHPILQEILFGNYRSYLDALIHERKRFSYPPYTDFVTLRVHHTKKPIVEDLMRMLMSKITPLLTDDIFCAHDQEVFTRLRSEYVQKIILKGRGVSDILESLQ